MNNTLNSEGVRFVIARYNESLNWLPYYLRKFPGAKCTVYNKGPELSPTKFYDVIKLPNVGRESHTYLHHIISNYESIKDDILVFLQGYPFDHCDVLWLNRRINTGINNIKNGSKFENIGTQIIKIIESNPLHKKDLKEELIETGIDIFGVHLPYEFNFSAGAMFSIPSSVISNRPLSFYKKAIGHVDKECNPIRGHCFERIWSLLFSYKI